MKRIFYSLLCMLLVLSACTSKHADKDVEEITLQGEALEPENAPFMKMPFRIGLADSKLVLFDLASDSCFYHVLEYPSFKYLYSIGRKGQGENEIALATPFQLHDGSLFILDGVKGDIYQYNLPDGKLKRKYATSLVSSIDFACKSDSVFYIGSLSGKERIIEWTPQQRQSHFEIPSSGQETTDQHLTPYVWRSYMDYHPQSGQLALAAQHGELIEIYDMGTYQAKLICEGEDVYPSDLNECRGYNDVHWVDNDLYALYTAETSKERDEQLKKDNKRVDGGNILRIFDREGTLKKQYKLDVYINGFTVDTQNNRLIGITSNSDASVIVWELPAN